MICFAVSDIHGHYTALKAALDEAGFDPKNEQHLLIGCGDYFDRGNENLKVLQYLDRLRNKVLLRGNHEDMLLEIFRSGRLKEHNFRNGTVETISELFGKYAIDALGRVDFTGKSRMLDRITDFIEETVDYYETAQYVFTHGWLPTGIRGDGFYIDPQWRKASPARWEKARWVKWNEMYTSCDRLPDKTIVCGHMPAFYAHKFDPSRENTDPSIFHGEGVVVLDGGTYTSGTVNVFVFEDQKSGSSNA